jgi:hypothetical protein
MRRSCERCLLYVCEWRGKKKKKKIPVLLNSTLSPPPPPCICSTSPHTSIYYAHPCVGCTHEGFLSSISSPLLQSLIKSFPWPLRFYRPHHQLSTRLFPTTGSYLRPRRQPSCHRCDLTRISSCRARPTLIPPPPPPHFTNTHLPHLADRSNAPASTITTHASLPATAPFSAFSSLLSLVCFARC